MPTASTGTTVPRSSLQSSGVMKIAPSVVMVVIITDNATYVAEKQIIYENSDKGVNERIAFMKKHLTTLRLTYHKSKDKSDNDES